MQHLLRFFALLILTFFILFSANSAMAAIEKYALLIGIGDYSGAKDLTSLDGTLNDIDLTQKVLLQERFGFKDENIVVLKDKEATHTGIQQAMEALAAQVKKNGGAMVYIHYSGHGSRAKDYNGDEDKGLDSTWVSYGARTELVKGIDQWDILDDELRQWLLNISDHADQVVMVSDSCHSGSITRGTNPAKTRSVGPVQKKHPLAENKFRTGEPDKGVFVGAAMDSEEAGEYVPDETSYGLFSWYWAQSLQNAQPSETWSDLVRKTQVQVLANRGQQHPQIRGAMQNKTVFAGSFAPEPHFMIQKISGDKKSAGIDHGTVTGATVGSVYTLLDSDKTNQASLPRLTLTSCKPFECIGEIQGGTFHMYDTIVEETHAYTIEPVTIAVDGDFAQDGDKVVDTLRRELSNNGIQGYTLVSPAEPHTITLYVTRPDQQSSGSSKVQHEGDIFPPSSRNAGAEVWVLDGTNHFWHDKLKLQYKDPERFWKLLQENLQKISRDKEVMRLSSVVPAHMNITVNTWLPDASCTEDCQETEDDNGFPIILKKTRTFNFNQMADQNLKPGDLLTFDITNTGESAMYTYLLNIGPDGECHLLTEENDQDALLGRTKKMSSSGLELSQGNETLKLLAAKNPIPVGLLTHEGFTNNGNTDSHDGQNATIRDKAAPNSGKDSKTKGEADSNSAQDPLSALLGSVIEGTTRGTKRKIDRTEWGTLQMSVNVQPEN